MRLREPEDEHCESAELIQIVHDTHLSPRQLKHSTACLTKQCRASIDGLGNNLF